MSLLKLMQITTLIDILKDGYPEYEFRLCPDCHEHFLKKVVTPHMVTYWICIECGYSEVEKCHT